MSSWTEVADSLATAIAASERVLDGGEPASTPTMPELPSEPPSPEELRRLRQELGRAGQASQVLRDRLDEVRAELMDCRQLRRGAGDYRMTKRR